MHADGKHWTEDGSKLIEEIAIGDLVWSRDEHDPDGANVLNAVTELFQRTTTDMSVLTVKIDEPANDNLLVLASAANRRCPAVTWRFGKGQHLTDTISANPKLTGYLSSAKPVLIMRTTHP